MRRLAFVLLLGCLGVAGAQDRPTLLDFEHGLDGWWTNPWGGGKITAEPTADAKYGEGALHAVYTEVDGKLNGNTISPFLPQDAPWRQGHWSAISFWYKTKGELPTFTLQLGQSFGEGQPELTFSHNLPPSDEWTRMVLTPSMLWNRQKQRLDLSRLGRLILNGRREAELWLDEVVLLPAGREVALDPYTTDAKLLELAQGEYQVEANVPVGAKWSATIEVPGGGTATRSGTREGEDAYLTLAVPVNSEGRGKLTITTPAGATNYQFGVFLPAPPVTIEPLGIFPTPKQCRAGQGAWTLPETLTGSATGGAAESCVEELSRREGWRTTVKVRSAAGGPGQTLVLGQAKLPALPADLKPEGYALTVTTTGAAVHARDDRGLLNGTLSLLAMIDAAGTAKQVAVPTADIVDWPDVAIRSLSIPLPTSRWGHPNDTPVPVDFYLDFLDRMVVRGKYNQVILLTMDGVKLDRHPELAGPAAWTKGELTRVLDFLRARFIEVVPLVNSLGHANWLCIPHPELAEDQVMGKNRRTGQPEAQPDIHTMCTSNPETWRIMVDVYEELLDLFQCREFHIGLDEVRWQTLNTTPELRCPLCQGLDKADVMTAWVTRLHDWLAERGVKTMMWTDMLTVHHNGGAPFNLYRVLDRLPRDIVMCNWSSSLGPQHTWELRAKGYGTVYEGNSNGLNRERATACAGNLQGMWDKVPWNIEQVGGPKGYAWPLLLESAEYSWRLAPELDSPKPGLSTALLDALPAARAALALAPEPAGSAQVMPLDAKGTEPVAGWFKEPPAPVAWRDVKVPVWSQACGDGAMIEVGQKVAALYLLEASDLSGDALKTFRDVFKDKANHAGCPIATLTCHYADGTTAETTVRFGWDVCSRVAENVPYAYGVLATPTFAGADGGRVALYLRQWVNPQPEKMVQSLSLKALVAEAQPLLLGAAIRLVK